MVYICFAISLQDICQLHTLQIPFSSNFLHMFAHLHDVWRWVLTLTSWQSRDRTCRTYNARPQPRLAWVLCAAASSRFVPLFFASFRNCFDARGSISWRTRAWPATKRVQRGTRRRSTLQKVRVERCVGLASCVNRRFRLLSLPVTLNQAGALPAIGVQEGERELREREGGRARCAVSIYNFRHSIKRERETFKSQLESKVCPLLMGIFNFSAFSRHKSVPAKWGFHNESQQRRKKTDHRCPLYCRSISLYFSHSLSPSIYLSIKVCAKCRGVRANWVANCADEWLFKDL